MQDQEALEIVQSWKEKRKVTRKKRYYGSKLDRYEKALVALRIHGATLSELQEWLKSKRVKVCESTLSRFLSKHPEIKKQELNDA